MLSVSLPNYAIHFFFSFPLDRGFLETQPMRNLPIEKLFNVQCSEYYKSIIALFYVPGQRFALREGGRTVGAGVVAKVIS